MKDQLQMATNVVATNAAMAFFTESLRMMIPWMIVMVAIIVCDLFAGVRRRYLMNEKIRITKGARDTGSKIVTYSAIVAAMVMWGVVAENQNIPYYTISGIYVFEGISIIGNLLKPKGYNLNASVIISLLAKKIFNIDKEYSTNLITRDEKDMADIKKEAAKTSGNIHEDKRLSSDNTCNCGDKHGDNDKISI